MEKATRFEKINTERQFYFIDFEEIEIEKTKFLKVNILDKLSNTVFSVYTKYTDDKYDVLADLEVFDCIDEKINVLYKNGRLKFNLELSR